jgi:hypothetical protein
MLELEHDDSRSARLAMSPGWVNRVHPAVRRFLVQDGQHDGQDGHAGQGGAPAPAPVEELGCFCLGNLSSPQ